MDDTQSINSIGDDTATVERPLVTFALFAYNQEKYIREAVEGAFSQTYEPLEIILSDDCSTDRTFEIIQEMAAEYRGPHLVRVLQTPENVGILSHVLMRGKQASGNIIVVAAGDDVSMPDRTMSIVKAFQPDVGCVYSNVSIIDEHGCIIASKAERPLHLSKPYIYLRRDISDWAVIQGCAAAYRGWVFDIPINPQNKKYAEDILFSFYIQASGANIYKINDALLKYRRHADAISNNIVQQVSAVQHEKHSLLFAEINIDLMEDLQRISKAARLSNIIDMVEIERVRSEALELIAWKNLSFASRLASCMIFCGKTYTLPFKWRLTRLWGSYPKYQPKIFLVQLQRFLT